MLQAIYGHVKSALLWPELHAKKLKGMGFKVNPHERCVSNKEMSGKQWTVAWCVDDNKLSHVDPKIFIEILEVIIWHFGYLVISRGNEHDSLGMTVIIDVNNKNLTITMREKLKKLSKWSVNY